MAISSHQWQSVAISTHLDFGVTKLGMPDIDAQDDARARRVVPHLVLEGIVKDEHLVLVPRPHLSGAAVISGKQCHSAVISCHQWYYPHLIGAADATSIALWHVQAQMQTKPPVARAAVRTNVRAGREHREEGRLAQAGHSMEHPCSFGAESLLRRAVNISCRPVEEGTHQTPSVAHQAPSVAHQTQSVSRLPSGRRPTSRLHHG